MTGFRWTDAEVREALGLSPERAEEGLEYAGVGTDSRTVGEGELFVALVGERFDGHDFVADALARGARGAVVSRSVEGVEAARLYPVSDTLVALGDLARHRRRRLGARVVGITGSSGKTTTKDLVEAALKGSYRVHATPGNLNNRVGLPLTILSAPGDTEVLVLELGTNLRGEIGILTGIAEPEIGVITTVAEVHLEGLGSLEGVLEEKLDLLRGLREPRACVVGDDPPELPRAAGAFCASSTVVGWSGAADPAFRPGEPGTDERGRFHFRWRGEWVRLRIPGRHSVLNALLALAVADLLEVPSRDAARRIGAVEPAPLRGEVRTLGGVTLVLDCYNANPQSVRAALDLLATYPDLGDRVAVLGSMLELGARSAALHREVLEEAMERPVDRIVATGLFAEAAGGVEARPGGPELVVAPTLDDAFEALREGITGSEVVLLKASRGAALERLVPRLEGWLAPGAPVDAGGEE